MEPLVSELSVNHTSPMSDRTLLSNHFLIAMPALSDPNFSQTVTYICEHNDAGAMGIIINRPMEFHLDEVLEHMHIDSPWAKVNAQPVYNGGPVQSERGFVLHHPRGQWESSLDISPDIAVTTSRDVLEAIARGEGPEDSLVALGYAGWGEGQLEREMAENAWLAGPMTPDLMFHTPTPLRWRAAAALLGVNLDLMSGQVGHA